MGEQLPDAYEPETIPEVRELDELDELETFVDSKNKIWLWSTIDHFKAGILGWVIGDHSGETFEVLWNLVHQQRYFLYVMGGNKVYPNFIADGNHIVSKTYMTWVEGENTRLRHYLA